MAVDYFGGGGYYPYGGQWGYGQTGSPMGFPGVQNQYSTWAQTQQPKATQDDIYFPTGTEATQWAAGIPGFQQQADILGSISNPQGFQSIMQPYINQMLSQLGRSGLPSSSYADRMIAETLGNVYTQNALNLASGWGKYMEQMGPWAGGYGEYPLAVSQLLQG